MIVSPTPDVSWPGKSVNTDVQQCNFTLLIKQSEAPLLLFKFSYVSSGKAPRTLGISANHCFQNWFKQPLFLNHVIHFVMLIALIR